MVPAAMSPETPRRVHLGRPGGPPPRSAACRGDAEAGRELAHDAPHAIVRIPGPHRNAGWSSGLPNSGRGRPSRRAGSRSSSRRSPQTRPVDALREVAGQASGRTSFAKPGSMPLTWEAGAGALADLRDPLDHLRRQDLLRPLEQHRPRRGDVDAGLGEVHEVVDRVEDPGRRSSRCGRSRPASPASSACLSVVARTPTRGPGRPARRRPCRPSPGSTPTPPPARGRVGVDAAIAWRPTVPVDQTTTFSSSSHAGQSRTGSSWGRGGRTAVTPCYCVAYPPCSSTLGTR